MREAKVNTEHRAGHGAASCIKDLSLQERERATREMADAVIKFALDKIGTLLVQEAALLYGVRTEVEWLQTQLRWMECFLIDADRKRKRGDQRVKNWVSEVRDIAYQAEDIVDTFMSTIHRQRLKHNERGILGLHKRYARLLFKPVALHNLSSEIELIRSKIHGISESREAYGIVHLSKSATEFSKSVDNSFKSLRQLSPHLDDDTEVVGFDTSKRCIVERLLDANMRRRCVVSIVGMGGLGKTTLATRVFNCSEIKSHFRSACVWISVSQDYRISEVLKNIIKKLLENTEVNRLERLEMEKYEVERLEKMDEIELKLKLHGILKEKRYLVAIDDIWSTEVWEQIKSALPNTMNGSRVLFTTRITDVAKAADPRVPPYELPLLSDEQSWELFLKKTFPTNEGVQPSCPKNLEELGRDLVRRCGRLPLAVVVLACLLSTKDRTYNAWRRVADNMNWELKEDGRVCLQILAMSYNDLPDHRLKSCFLYIGSFPKAYPIKTSVLVKLWVAEGFIPQSENQTMEDIAMGYIDKLCQRSMIQVVQKSLTDERVKTFRIHDLFRELCISIANEDSFFKIHSANCNKNDVPLRRLVLYDKIEDYEKCFASKPRTLLGFNFEAEKGLLRFHKFKLLKVIHLNWSPSTREFPEEITRLTQLKYLSLSCKNMHYLPKSIADLCNLQTLDLRETNIYDLPKALWKIETLRHVRTDLGFRVWTSEINSPPKLQTLEHIDAGLSAEWMRRDLARLASLRKLAIRYLSGNQAKMLCDSLCRLKYLTSLTLHSHEHEMQARPITSLENHPQLRKLSLHGPWTDIYKLPKNIVSISLEDCKLDIYSIATLGTLQNLVTLRLESCSLSMAEVVCSAGRFPQLQHLRIRYMSMLSYWRIEGGAMTNLTHLTIEGCSDLKMMPDGLEHIVSLDSLEMISMLPSFLRRVEEGGEDWYKIRHVPFIDIRERR